MSSNLSRRVMKATGIFGGVQMVNILCSIVRTKIVALWIGTVGVGLFGVFNSAIDLMSSFTLMGLRSSATRDIAVEEGERRERVILVVRRLSIVLGLLGTVIVFFAAPLLSRLSFGDDAHTTAFRWLSISLLFMGVCAGETAILQGVSRLKAVARAGIWGTVASALSAIPLVWLYRVDGVVPVIIVGSFFAMIGALANRYRFAAPVKMALREMTPPARSLLVLGFFLTIGEVVSYLASYVLISYINTSHGTAMTGLYQTGYTLINKYIGLALSAIGMEYYPRLATVKDRKWVSEVFVSHEIKMVLMMLVPMMSVYVVASPLVVELLYTSNFEDVVPFVEIGAIGSLFRGISWCIAFVMIARGDGRIFLVTEVASATVYVVLNVLTINTLGIAGMGYAYIGWYGIYLAIVAAVYSWRYGMNLRRGIARRIALSLAGLTAVVAVVMLFGRVWGAVAALAVICLSLLPLVMGKGKKLRRAGR